MYLPWILVLLLGISIPVIAEYYIEFKEWPVSVTARVHEKAIFECTMSVPAEKIVWRSNPALDFDRYWDKWIDIEDGVESNNITSKIVITAKTSLWFQCVAWYGGVTLASVPARLTIANMDITNNNKEKRFLYVPATNDVVMHCKPPKSDPPAALSWWKENQSGRRPIDSHHGLLIRNNVTLDDTGIYGCTALNELTGQKEVLPEITYLQVEKIKSDVENRFLETDEYLGPMKDGKHIKILQPNESLRLWCGAVGLPRPVITWTWNDKELPRESKITQTTQHLFISRFRAEDEGTYTCSYNKNSRRMWLVRISKDPYWDDIATGVNVSEGGTARVSCGKPHGYPPPRVHWLLNSKPIFSNDRVNLSNSELIIERVAKRHAGIVQCFACNDHKCAYDAALLTVIPMQITDSDYAGDITMADRFPMHPPKRHNRKNSRKHKAVLIPPTRPNVTRMSNNSVMVTWSSGKDGLPIQFFKVQYREVDNTNKSWQTANEVIPPNIHSYLIGGLIPDKHYKFRIAAVYSNQDNKLGKSSLKFYLQKGGFLKPHAPKLISVEAVSPTQMKLNWTWSSGGGVQTEGFYAYYRALTTAGEYDKALAGPNATHLIISHLKPDKAYEFKLQAYTAQAPSDFSSILTGKTKRGASSQPPVSSTTLSPSTSSDKSPGALLTAAGALGVALVLVAVIITMLVCRRARRSAPHKEKNSRADNSTNNGYIPAKVPITITSNPLHNETGDNSVEMSFMHNNNGNTATEDGAPHSRKNTMNSRNYV